MQKEKTKLHSMILFVKRKLKHLGRRDFSFNQAPNRNIRIEIHAIQNSSSIFVRVADKVPENTYVEYGKEIFIEKWVPIKEFKFFPEKEGRIKQGSILIDSGEGWERYSPSKIDRDKKIRESLKHLKELIKKADRVKSYKQGQGIKNKFLAFFT